MGSSKLYVAPLGADPADRSQWREVGYVDSVTLYAQAQKLDEWPGEDHERSDVIDATCRDAPRELTDGA